MVSGHTTMGSGPSVYNLWKQTDCPLQDFVDVRPSIGWKLSQVLWTAGTASCKPLHSMWIGHGPATEPVSKVPEIRVLLPRCQHRRDRKQKRKRKVQHGTKVYKRRKGKNTEKEFLSFQRTDTLGLCERPKESNVFGTSSEPQVGVGSWRRTGD